MEGIVFSWDEKKNKENRRKYGVSFEEASTAFYDQNARLIRDPRHTEDENRFILLGLSAPLRLLVVCHCYRRDDYEIRIISARKARKKETEEYGGFLK